jgi:hypothetical protein
MVCGKKEGQKMNKLQRGGIEPPTSAVLKPRHNQLDHLCLSPLWLSSQIIIKAKMLFGKIAPRANAFSGSLSRSVCPCARAPSRFIHFRPFGCSDSFIPIEAAAHSAVSASAVGAWLSRKTFPAINIDNKVAWK